MGDAGAGSHPAGAAEAVQETFEHLSVAVCGFSGPEHRYDAANAAYRELMQRHDVLGQAGPKLFPELVGQQMFELFDRVYHSGKPESVREWRFQFDTGDTGERREVFVDMVLAPRRAADDSVTGLTVVATEVSERVREREAAQRQAAEAEQRFRAARDVVAELQEALLPNALPVLPGATIAARYLVATHDQTAGGDWFDAVPLADGTVALVVGDIVGHGVTASAAMGQLRAVLAVVLTQTGDLAQALAWADRMAAGSPAMRAATVCVAVLDPATGALRYSTCGHPPPLLIAADGSSRFLAPSGNGPLGTGSTPVIAAEALTSDAVLLVYSDGLIERPGQSLSAGMATLAQVAGDAVANRVMPVGASASAVERACQQGVELLTGGGYDDDVTALAAQRRPAPIGPLRHELPAEPQRLAEVRAAVRGWVAQLEPILSDRQAVDLAVSELVANAVEHAYQPGASGVVRVSAELATDGFLQMTVADDGTWRGPTEPEETSGRGLWMVGAALDYLNLDRARDDAAPGGRSQGTVVTVRHRLRRPAMLASNPPSQAPRRTSMEFATQLEEGPPRVLRVSGPLDIATAGRFADRLTVASRGGVHPVVVDLTDVEVLASAGVRVLFAARSEYAVHGHPLTIIAAPDSLAGQVLDLVGLEHQQT